MLRIKTIDAHAAGQPCRLIVDGFPPLGGRTILEQRAVLQKKHDHLRRTLLLEPRGHRDMCGAVFVEPTTPGSHAGVLFMRHDGYVAVSGHGVIAATTIALERDLIVPGVDPTTIVYDTPAGTVRARAVVEREAGEGPRVHSVAFVNVPSFVLHAGLAVDAAGRRFRADVAFGGAFYAVVDAESVGLPLDVAHTPELRRAAAGIRDAIEAVHSIRHPLLTEPSGIEGIVFTGPAHGPEADLRGVTIFGDAAVDRSPSGAATSAVMAVLDAMNLLGADRPFVHESLTGTHFTGRVAGRTQVGDYEAIVPEIEGSAWITGEHTFLLDENDPLKDGFLV